MMLPPQSKLIQSIAHSANSGSAANGTAVRTESHVYHIFAFKNGWDQNVTVTWQGSNDSSFTNAWPITDAGGSPISTSVASGGGYAYESLTDAWTYVRPVFTPAGDPTSGTLTYYHFAK